MCRRQYVLALITAYVGLTHSWDVAVSIGDVLEFYTNGTKTNAVHFKSLNVTTITYDEVHNMMLFVDKQRDYDAICGYNLSTEDIRCFVKRKGSNIHDLAFEPATNLLFFTDTKEQSINWISLEDQESESNVYGNVLIKMNDRTPVNIGVDSCKGYIYWTNQYSYWKSGRVYMERAKLFSSETQDIYKYLKIHTFAIDLQTQKNYFIAGAGLSFFNKADLKAENFNKEKEIIYQNKDRSTKKLTVSKDYIYWVSSSGSQKTVWQILKNATKLTVKPKKFFSFYTGTTLGIATNYRIQDQVQGLQDCEVLSRFTQVTETEPTTETYQSSYMEETTELDETTETEQTSETYQSSYMEETTELDETTETEQTSETYQSSYMEETTELDETTETEQTSETYESSYMEETTELDETTETEQTSETYQSSYMEETTELDEITETEQTSETYLSSYMEETTELDETTDMEQNTALDETLSTELDETTETDSDQFLLLSTAELYQSSYTEETTELDETTETEQTAETYQSSYTEETTELDETAETYQSSYTEETTELDETTETEQTAETYQSSYMDETTELDETTETEQTAETYQSSYMEETTELDETTDMEQNTALDETLSTEIYETSETELTAETEVELAYRCNAICSKKKLEDHTCHSYCMNNGDRSLNTKSEPVCQCKGDRCEVACCLNYCFQGICGCNKEGHPVCRCNAGYSGERCEVYACHSYCLNNGECTLNEEGEPVCECVGNYEGSRCEAVKNNAFTFTIQLFSGNEKGIKVADLLSKTITKISTIVEVI